MSEQLAWIGLGNMGRGMVKNLVEKGNLNKPLIIHNRTAARAEKLASTLPKEKVKVETDLSNAISHSDIIFTCLSDDSAVEATITSALNTPNISNKLFVDCSTIHPDTTDKLAKQITTAGHTFVACPVFGAPAMADAGQLICVFAGPKASIDRVRQYGKGVMGRANIDYSDRAPGDATRLKVVGNTMILAMVESLAEGHVLAETSGVGNDKFHELIELLFPGPHAAYSKRLMGGGWHGPDAEPLFAADLARKDARHALELAGRGGAKMKGLEVADAHLKRVQEVSKEKGDLAGVYGAVREESGLKFEN